MKANIHFWHGRVRSLDDEIRLKLHGHLIENGNDLIFEGSLDEFVELYGEKFIFFPSGKWNIPTICVTHHSTFAQS